MNTFWQDIQFTLRSLKRSPGFAAAAIGTLALGIGATTAIFSTVNAALLKPLPYPNPEGIYAARTALTDGRPTTGLLSPVEITRLNDPSLSIIKAVGLQQQQLTLMRDGGSPSPVTVYGVSDGFFELFGLPMTHGSAFMPEHYQGNGPPVVVISHRFWASHILTSIRHTPRTTGSTSVGTPPTSDIPSTAISASSPARRLNGCGPKASRSSATFERTLPRVSDHACSCSSRSSSRKW